MVALDGEKLKQQSYILLGKLIRTKDPSRLQEGQHAVDSKLNKVLTTLDLTSLGVGSCVGTGMYLVAGMVAKTIAGPGVILSFTIAAIASIFSGVCYAEFGVRVPNTSGGAYVYSYVTVGELMAFIIGWNMVLEELIGTSACACALSACFDAIFNGAISDTMRNSFGTLFGEPPDLLAFFLTVLMGGVLVAGVRKSVIFNNALNVVNFVVWVFIMIAGFFYADSTNWTQNGGFLPMGWSGVLTGAATCFYAFIGFDIIATTGEEAINARKSIPYSIVYSLVIILIAYVSSSAVITLMVPYNELDADSALVKVFGQVGAYKCKNFVAVGALAGLTVSMFGSMFSLPRIVYSMAKDGLVFKSLSNVWDVTGTPAVATIVFGLGAAFAAMFISLTVLVEMMSIGTLLAYTLVSTCVLILRYQPHSTTLLEMLPESIRTPLAGTPLPGSPTRSPTNKVMRSSPDSDDTGNTEEGSESWRREDDYMVSDRYENRYYGSVPAAARVPRWYDRYLEMVQQRFPTLFPWVEEGPCTEDSGRQVMKLVGLLYVNVLVFDILLVACIGELEGHSSLASFFSLVFFFSIIYILLLISRKPQNRRSLPFLAPGLPWVPAVAIIINVYLIFKLSILTLIRFVLWMTIGFIIYFYYGIKKSVVGLGTEGDIELHITSKQSTQAGTTISPPTAHTLSPNTAALPQNQANVPISSTTTPDLFAPPSNATAEGVNEGGSMYVSPNPNNPFR
ncbi:probable cationic amino acid transporter isoform X2 [Portunus trituberculatus]|uniref:probable cationic amino acid transporter isoform X2 n=1 Tax=Portunus trituberculatus TaxID=210409 RepID=UPI001E1CE114|nr:probable cationic amino acid transporter isoform X2 [Portunus trituberculatus]